MLDVGKGEWSLVKQTSDTDEIQKLVSGFNTMVENLQQLSSDIVLEQEKKKKAEVSMVETQLKLLQSQINPHFIHNTLNTMNYLAKKEGNTKLSEMIFSFNSLLRSSMSYDEMFVSIAEEIENLRNFINIQKMRYDDEVEIKFICNVESEADEAILPKLIVQPLVENALYHGIAPTDGGVISVTVGVRDNRLSIEVRDDGIGINNAVLEEISRGKHLKARRSGQMGIDNVNERLLLYYGESSRLNIKSIPDEGTVISFTIPFETGDEEDML